jgi:hypothetical protein
MLRSSIEPGPGSGVGLPDAEVAGGEGPSPARGRFTGSVTVIEAGLRSD